MVDPRIQEFRERLDLALATEQLSRPDFARALGVSGQQLVHNWRKRGRIGQESLPAVRELLPNTSMEWLNDGVGDPPPKIFSGSGPSSEYDSTPSQVVSHQDLILALQMVAEALEGQDMMLEIPKRAAVTASVYTLVQRRLPHAEILQFIRAAIA